MGIGSQLLLQTFHLLHGIQRRGEHQLHRGIDIKRGVQSGILLQIAGGHAGAERRVPRIGQALAAQYAQERCLAGAVGADNADAVAALEEREMSCDIVFLEASDEVLIRRYSENRRRHPIAKPGETTADAIQRERLQLQGVRDRADMIIDTSRLRTSALRNKLRMAFSELSDQQLMDVHVFSFGFKHGMPVEADIMIDVRFLPNPFYDPEMRTMTGLDKKVSDFVLDHPKTQEFWKAWTRLLDTVMPGYIAEGKPQLSIAIGCTGGQHRSVAIAEATARYLEGAQYHVSISHRDLSRANTKA